MLLVCLTTLRYRNTCKRQNFFSSNLPNHKEQGQPKGWPCSFSLSKNPYLEKKRFVLRGEYEGAGAPSCWIECLQTGCGSSPLRRKAACASFRAVCRGPLLWAEAAFCAAKQTKKRGVVQAVKACRILWLLRGGHAMIEPWPRYAQGGGAGSPAGSARRRHTAGWRRDRASRPPARRRTG